MTACQLIVVSSALPSVYLSDNHLYSTTLTNTNHAHQIEYRNKNHAWTKPSTSYFLRRIRSPSSSTTAHQNATIDYTGILLWYPRQPPESTTINTITPSTATAAVVAAAIGSNRNMLSVLLLAYGVGGGLMLVMALCYYYIYRLILLTHIYFVFGKNYNGVSKRA